MTAGITAVHRQAYPGSFIGRQIGFYAVRHVDLNAGNGSNPVLDSENFRLAIQAIQTQAEILFIGNPTVSNSWASFIVGIAQDTLNDGNDTVGNIKENTMSDTIQSILRGIPSLNDNAGQAIFERRWLFGYELQTTSNYLSSIQYGLQGGTLPEPETFAPGSVEDKELSILQE